VLRGYGGDVFKTADFSDGDYTPQLGSDAAKAAMTTHLALAKLTPPGVENTDHATNGRNLYSGLTASSGDIWPDQLLQIIDPTISKVVGKVKIGAEPAQASVAHKDMTGNWLLGIPNGSKNVDATLDFILWFTAPEQQKTLLLNHQVPATRTSVMQDADAVAKFPFLPGLLSAGQNAVPRPRTELYPTIDETILGVYVAQAIAGQITGDQALKKANDDITALMKREGKIK
jgi:ABC-type glycerol-3-phosphate transport system substrate-binding protein